MKKLLPICVTIWAILDSSDGISTKVDFDEDSTSNSTNSDDDVEVKHTIVVSTKLKNNNRRGMNGNDGNTGSYYNTGRNERKKDDSGEVPILTGYKAVESTQIRTPDSRNKPQIPLHRPQPSQGYPNSGFINRNIRDEYDVYPNIALNPTQWKPSTLFNNINWWSQDSSDSNIVRYNRPESNFIRSGRPTYPDQVKLQRKITDDGIKEFYCRKCREMSNDDDCSGRIYQKQQRRVTTTPKMKIDGKLAKLN